MFTLQCICLGLEFIKRGIKINIGRHSFIIIKGQHFYYVYKRYTNSVVCVENIEC